MNRIVFSIILACTIVPAVSVAQTGKDPDHVQSAKNRVIAAEQEKSRAAEAAKNAPARSNTKNGPVTVSGPATIAGAPKVNSSGKKFIDPANMDLSVKPGDNFYLYANGTW